MFGNFREGTTFSHRAFPIDIVPEAVAEVSVWSGRVCCVSLSFCVSLLSSACLYGCVLADVDVDVGVDVDDDVDVGICVGVCVARSRCVCVYV